MGLGGGLEVEVHLVIQQESCFGLESFSYQQPPSLRVSLPSTHTLPPLFSLPQEILGKIIEKQEPEQGQKWSEVAKDHLFKTGRQAEDQAASCLPGKSLGLAGDTVPKFMGPKGDLETHLQIRGLFP